ncbi:MULTISPECIES: hypothetical protein [Xanthobacter]|uniref:hypothetical protein n=1 Tax=Xanthobacter TaxID=279 RepID=UPI001F33A165|nr:MULTISPECIES: hypothetical protein [unclassified Xanthobacter]
MSMMRPRKRTCPSLRSPVRPAFGLLARSAFAASMLAAAAGLSACSGDSTLTLPVPPHPDVPEVAHDSYPTIGATPHTGRPALNEAQRARLQGDLERASKTNSAKAQAAAQASTPAAEPQPATN